MGLFDSNKLLYVAVFLFLLVAITSAENRQIRTPARVLAKQTGATQFQEERYETNKDCNEHKHHLKKRASDEDVDYEVYQGVVGRPGIDFPIYPRIPKTSFSCRSFGNGYFADMDTDCQVFHICEEGRKISFLCPNGTIFQQSELTCDWWFKVNCLGSPGYYAESAEILNKQRHHRVRPSVPVKGFNIVGGGLNIKPKVNNVQARTKSPSKSDRRIDSSEQQPSVEAIDFEDISDEKHLKGQQPNKVISNIDDNNNENESQITAESASFVSGRNRNNYNYEKPSDLRGRVHNGDTSSTDKTASSNSQIKGYSNPPSANTEPNERARNGQRGQQRFKEEKKPTAESFEKTDSNEDIQDVKKGKLPEKLLQPIGSKETISNESDVKPEYYQPTTHPTERPSSTTYPYIQGTYSTARKLDSTRTTPYYTPTVPPVSKLKSTEGKSIYAKGNKGPNNIVATTPNSNRLNGNSGNTNLILEQSATPKVTQQKVTNGKTSTSTTTGKISTTFRPFIIGMRHHNDRDYTLSEPNKFDNIPATKQGKPTESGDYLPTTTPATTGPTYLPKHSASPRGSIDAAGDDLLLFAPNPIESDSIARNLDEMLKTMNLLKSKLSDTDGDGDIKGTGPARTGLEIPPSSGPDVLISLAKYFATEEQNESNDKDKKKPTEKQEVNSHSAGVKPSKPSDTTATVTTAATPKVPVKSENIKDSLLSMRTVDRYTSLFGLNKDTQTKQGAADVEVDSLNKAKDLNSSKSKEVQTPFPQIGSTDSTIRELSQKPETRKIAQVFSNALSTYLDDPKTFRQQLQSIRPTEPTTVSVRTSNPNFTPAVATDSGLFRSGTAASYLPTKPTSSIKLTTTTRTSIAAEINDKFDYSTQFPDLTSTTEIFDTTTYRPIGKGRLIPKHQLELSAELSPPTSESGEGEEFLHREQTQSFIKTHNDLTSQHIKDKKVGKVNEAYVAVIAKTTENPWNSISQTDFLDPLTINDGLMKETKTTTLSPFTYLPKQPTTTQQYATRNDKLRVPPSAPASSQARNIGSHFSLNSAEVTTHPSINAYSHVQESDSWRDILSSYDLPLETLPSSNGLQRIANRLFGGLNESEALHLKNVMQQAEHNRQVLRLLLLLIQTCDDQNGKALERSRKHLLNALIDMDGKIQSEKESKVSYQKATATVTTTTTRSPSVTVTAVNKRDEGPVDGTSTFAYPATTTTTDIPISTSTATTTTTSSSGSVEETTKFEIRVEDPEEDQLSTASTIHATNTHSSSDRRALELLKSLYSLASKFTSRR